MALPSMPPFVCAEPIEYCLIRGLLQVNVKRGVNFQSAFMHLVGSILIFQIAPDLFHEVRRQRVGIMLQTQSNRLASGVGGLRGRDLSILQHCVDDQIPALQRALWMVDRGVDAWSFG